MITDTRFSENTIKTISWFLILTVLIYAGIFVYAWWDLKHFKASLEKLSTVSPGSLVQLEIELAPEGLEMEIEAPSLEALDRLIEAPFLFQVALSEEEMEEVQRKYIQEHKGTRTNALQVRIDSGSFFKSLISNLQVK